MQEVKYQLWDARFKVMNKVLFLDLVEGAAFVEMDGAPSEWVGVEDGVVLRQYTGIKDKNDREIYDGDIVRCFSHSISKVELKKGCFGLITDGLHEPYFAPFTDIYGYCEILGNIYENPELLEVSK